MKISSNYGYLVFSHKKLRKLFHANSSENPVVNIQTSNAYKNLICFSDGYFFILIKEDNIYEESKVKFSNLRYKFKILMDF